MAGYRVLRYDTSSTVERKQLIAENEQFTSFHVLEVPSGADIELAIGSAEPFPIFAGFAADFCPAEPAGLFLNSSVVVTGQVVILAWFDGAVSGGPR